MGSLDTTIGSISLAVISAPLYFTSCWSTPRKPIVLQTRKLPRFFSGKWLLDRRPVAATGRTRLGNQGLLPTPLPMLTYEPTPVVPSLANW